MSVTNNYQSITNILDQMISGSIPIQNKTNFINIISDNISEMALNDVIQTITKKADCFDNITKSMLEKSDLEKTNLKIKPKIEKLMKKNNTLDSKKIESLQGEYTKNEARVIELADKIENLEKEEMASKKYLSILSQLQISQKKTT